MKQNFKAWVKAAGIRAIKTFAQTAISLYTFDRRAITEVDWLYIGSVAVVAAIYSLLTSIAGLPEVNKAGENKC